MGVIYLVTGGAASGKSEYSEELACSLGDDRYYVATMYPYDEESKVRVQRHRAMRDGKGFKTVECYTDIAKAAVDITEDCVVLLECMSNLLANEMYLEDGCLKADGGHEFSAKESEALRGIIDEHIVTPIRMLSKKCRAVIIVSNEIAEDGNKYDTETETYIGLLNYINRTIAEHADHAVRVVCSIPVYIGEKLCLDR